MTSYRKGLLAEIMALILFWVKGYKILKWRYKTPLGEIDLIASKKDLIIFIEVKHRKSREEALSAISPKSRRRIEKTALLFIQKNPHYEAYEMRFDVIANPLFNLPLHVKKAWIFGE